MKKEIVEKIQMIKMIKNFIQFQFLFIFALRIFSLLAQKSSGEFEK